MTEITSSAGKLHKILKKAFEQHYTASTIDVWSSAFALEEHEENEIARLSYAETSDKLTELFILFKQARQDISKLGDPYDDIGVKAISKIEETILGKGFEGIWDNIANEINEDTLNIIKICDGLLKRQGNRQKTIVSEQLNELSHKVNQLINDFIKSNLPNDFKLELISELRKIQDALIDFHITGEAHLQQVCNEVIGDIITKASEKPKLFKQFKGSVQKVVSMAVTIGGLMTTYDLSIKYQPVLADQIINLIENMPDETDDILQLKLEAVSKPQQMDAEIENNTNRKYLPSGEEE